MTVLCPNVQPTEKTWNQTHQEELEMVMESGKKGGGRILTSTESIDMVTHITSHIFSYVATPERQLMILQIETQDRIQASYIRMLLRQASKLGQRLLLLPIYNNNYTTPTTTYCNHHYYHVNGRNSICVASTRGEFKAT